MQADDVTEDRPPDAAEPVGRAKVRAYLIDPLAAMGLQRKRGQSVADHDKAMTALADKLAYMTPDNLRGLAEWVIRYAGHKRGKLAHWPPIASIIGWAYTLQPPPPRQSTYAQSIIRSVMGRAAADGGYLVELFRTARRMGPPPQAYLIFKMKEEADENRRRRARIRERIEAGVADRADRDWLARYHADLAEVQSIIDGAEGAEE